MMTQIGGGVSAPQAKKISFVGQTEFNVFADSILRFLCINQHIQSNRLLAAKAD